MIINLTPGPEFTMVTQHFTLMIHTPPTTQDSLFKYMELSMNC